MKHQQEIDEGVGGFTGNLSTGYLGTALSSLGDLDGNGITDLAVGDQYAPKKRTGAVWILFLQSDGTVRRHQKINQRAGGFGGVLNFDDNFGQGVAGLGDIDGDGFVDLAVGAPEDDDGGEDRGAVWILSLQSFVTIDFETENDSLIPLIDGQAITSALGFGSLLELDGFPLSGLTAAVFDSSPGGPNAFGRDPDLLVDRGNAMILQEAPSQITPGIYDFPDDDRFGGEFLFTFGGQQVRMGSVDLIDVCPGRKGDVTVTLIDLSAKTRSYLVPAGWTGDVAVHGPPGFGRLDLGGLADQPGFMATATAVEDPGFDRTSVVMMRIEFDGSAALDNLVYLRKGSVLTRSGLRLSR